MILKDYDVKKIPITIRNSQVNSIIERIHQTIDDVIRSFEVHSTAGYLPHKHARSWKHCLFKHVE
eukprot:12597282-Ditylum_brightwellii.AAC.1